MPSSTTNGYRSSKSETKRPLITSSQAWRPGQSRLSGTPPNVFLASYAGDSLGIEITFAGWVTSYGVLVGMAAKDAAILATLFWLTLSAGRLLAIPLLRAVSPWWVLCGCAALGLFTAWALHALWVPLTVGALLFGLAASAFFPTLYALSNQVMEMRGRTTGAIFTAAGSGASAQDPARGLGQSPPRLPHRSGVPRFRGVEEQPPDPCRGG